MIRQEIRMLDDGKYVFTWVRVSRWLPWILNSIEPFPTPEPMPA